MLPTVLLVLTVAAPPAAPPAPAEAFRQAEKLSAADQFGAAEPLYLRAIESDDRFLKRESYNRLLNLYLRSGRPDKAVALGATFRAWLTEVKDPDGFAELDLLLAQCRFELGYADEAEKLLAAALGARPGLAPDRRLDAFRLRAEVAAQRRAPYLPARWHDLEAAAAAVQKAADRANDGQLKIAAGRALAEARARLDDPKGALAALAPLPALHDRIEDPLGKRDTQRQRAALLAATGDLAAAGPLFAEALALHRAQRKGDRLTAGDILGEWSAAALAAGKGAEGAKLRDQAAAEYKAVLDAPAESAGGALVAFVRLQAMARSANQFAQALELVRTAGDRWSGDPLIDARLKADRGALELIGSAYPAAQKLLTAALADLDRANPPNLRALPKVLVQLATAELGADSPDAADARLVRVVELYAGHKLAADPLRAEADYLRGVAAARKGDFAGAMARFRAGLGRCDEVGADADPVRFNLWLNVALIHKEQGDAVAAEEALASASTTLARLTRADDLSAALIDAVRVDLLLSQGRVQAALALVPTLEAAGAKEGRQAGYLWAAAKHVRALDRLTRKDIDGAEALWRELAEAQKKDGHVLLARTLNFLGVCAELKKRPEEAAKRFEEARAFQAAHPRCPPPTRAITLWRLAVLQDRAGQKDEAKRLIGEVFDVADKARLNTFGEASQRATFFAQFSPAFEQLAVWCARDGDGEGLLKVVARSRSRTLLDQMLAAGVDPRDRLTGENRTALLAREAAARQTIAKLRSRAMLFTPEQADEPEAKKVLGELEAAQKAYTDTWREIANADPMTRVLTDPAFADQAIRTVRAEAHKAGGVVLAYMVGRDASYAILSTDPARPPQVFPLGIAKLAADIGEAPTGDLVARAGFRGISVKPVPQPDRPPAPASVELVALTDVVAARLVNHYVQQIADPGFNPTRGLSVRSASPTAPPKVTGPELLGDAVLPTALRAAIRASGAKRLVLVPDGALHKVPFEALLVSAGGKPTYAIDELPAISYGPSLAALAVVLNRPHKPGAATLLTVGDPAYPEAGTGAKRSGGALPRLPFTLVESQEVRKHFRPDTVVAYAGEEATEKNVAAALPGKRFVHLAAHGFADEAFGNAFAAVALAPPAGNGVPDSSDDGFLTLHEISRLNLSNCELTVLSACVTNVGPQRPLEAGVTLSGAFLGAGSRGVLASCWSVDDKATAALMGEFFGALKPGQTGGLAHPEAMKNARQAIRRNADWAAPFFWAPFVYVGPPG